MRKVRKEKNGWSVEVTFGGGMGPVTDRRRYVYRTRAQARKADISDDIGQRGRIQ